MEARPSCPLCDGSNIKKVYARGRLPISECSCGMVFLSSQDISESTAHFYGAEYYQSWGMDGGQEDVPRVIKHRTFQSWLRRVEALVTPGRLLDVGCATGFFLEVAASAGWDVAGVELSAYSAGLAGRKFGHRIFKGTLEQARFPDGAFELVTLTDLLEHIPKPRLFMKEVRRVLRDAGVLMIVTPNAASLSLALMGSKWSHFKLEHLCYFAPKTICRLLRDSGFALIGLESARKYLDFAYIVNQFKTYPHPWLSPLLKTIDQIVPERLKHVSLPLPCGEMLVLARKE